MPPRTKKPVITAPVLDVQHALVDLEADDAEFRAALVKRARSSALAQAWVSFRGAVFPLRLTENPIDLLDALDSDLDYLAHCLKLPDDGPADDPEQYRRMFKATIRDACDDPTFEVNTVLSRMRGVLNQRPTKASVS